MELNHRGVQWDRKRNGNPNCITEHPVKSGGNRSSVASAAAGKCQDQGTARDNVEIGNPHKVQ